MRIAVWGIYWERRRGSKRRKGELQTCTQLDPSHLEANLGLGLILMREGKTAEAKSAVPKSAGKPRLRRCANTAQKALRSNGALRRRLRIWHPTTVPDLRCSDERVDGERQWP